MKTIADLHIADTVKRGLIKANRRLVFAVRTNGKLHLIIQGDTNMKQNSRTPEQIILKWNLNHPIWGIPIDVTDDFGIVTRRVTESSPWILCGSVVIYVSGISGGYLLERCNPVEGV